MQLIIARLGERMDRAERDIEKSDKRQQTLEKDVAIIKGKIDVMEEKVDNIKCTADETRQDIKKAKNYFIATVIGFAVSVVCILLSTILK